MAILIDGYNLLNVTDLFGHGASAGTLEGSREALIRFVLSAVPASEHSHTTIVFDAKDPPPGVPSVYHRRGLTILYARDYADADELLVELIQADNAPRSLLVVSSDHQIQTAARRRRAKFIDSREWYFFARQNGASTDDVVQSASIGAAFSSVELADLERDAALIQEDESRGMMDALATSEPSADHTLPLTNVSEPAPKLSPQPKRRIGKRRSKQTRIEDAKDMNLANPFPPGYAEDELPDDER